MINIWSGKTADARLPKAKKKSIDKLLEAIREAVAESVSNEEKPYVLFSGGLDSSVIAVFARKANKNCRFLCIGTERSEDLRKAREVAGKMGLVLETFGITEANIRTHFPKLEPDLHRRQPDIELGILLRIAAEYVKKSRGTCIVCGQGAEELFAGYQRHENSFREKKLSRTDLDRDLRNLDKTDLNRNTAGLAQTGLNAAYPFLDEKVVSEARAFTVRDLFSNGERKAVLRKIARIIGVPEEAAGRPKKAWQYGSGLHKLLCSKKNGI